jgi:DNA-binding FadR family transcriptional regulator
MEPIFAPVQGIPGLHDQVTRLLALRVIEAARGGSIVAFPNEADLCGQLGVSRTVVRESMKVLSDKGMVELRRRTGTRALPRARWRQLDPDILSWQSELKPDLAFLRDLGEVRLAIEPTASGFAALRATPAELAAIEQCLERREAAAAKGAFHAIAECDLEFHRAVAGASHNPLLVELSESIRQPFRAALDYAARRPAAVLYDNDAHRKLAAALRSRDPLAARASAEEIVGLAMVALEEIIRLERKEE